MSTTVLLAEHEPRGLAERAAEPDGGPLGILEQLLPFDGFEIVAGSERRPDLVIAADGTALERWRGEVPVIVLGSPEAEPDERVLAFRQGCDDYVARPFHYEELVERIRAVLRRSQAPLPQVLAAGPLRVDLAARLVTVRGRPLALSKIEYALIVRLASNPTGLFTREELQRDVLGYASSVRTRSLDSHVSRLRRKLRRLDPSTSYVENEWGVGYRLLGIHASG